MKFVLYYIDNRVKASRILIDERGDNLKNVSQAIIEAINISACYGDYSAELWMFEKNTPPKLIHFTNGNLR